MTQTGGVVSVTGPSTISNGYTLTSGTLSLASGQTLAITGPASFGVAGGNGPLITGPGTLSTSGTTTLPTQSGGRPTSIWAARAGARWVRHGTTPASSAWAVQSLSAPT